MSQSIGDFFVKIGIQTPDLSGLRNLNAALNSANSSANSLIASLNKLPNALQKLNIPVSVTPAGQGTTTGSTTTTSNYTTVTNNYNQAINRQVVAQQAVQKNNNTQLKTGAKLISQTLQGKMTLHQLAGAMGEVSAATAASTLVVGGAVLGLTKLVNWATDAGESLFQFHLKTGMSTKSFQEWSATAAKFGAKSEDIASSIANIQQAQTDIQLGQGNIAPWALLGINPNQDPLAILTQIHNKIKEGGEISAAMGRKLTAQIGINDATFQMLRRADFSVTQLKRDLVLSDQEIANYDKLNQAFGALSYNVDILGKKLASEFRPSALGIVELLEDGAYWANALVAAFNKLSVSKVGDFVKRELNWLDYWLDPFNVFNNTTRQLQSGTLFNDMKRFGADIGVSPQASVSNKTNNVTINVNGAADPKVTAKAVSDEITKINFNSNASVSNLSMIGSTAY